MIRSIVSSAVAGLAGFAATKAVLASRLRTDRSVVRTNHAGGEVSLVEGPAVTAGLLAGGLLIEDPRQRAATLLVTGTAGALGAVDDFCESGSSKGLRGHLSALARGEITTGAIKIIGIPAASIAAAILLRTGTRRTGLFGLARPDEAASCWGPGSCEGLRGYPSALARGESTTGAIKIIGPPAAPLAAASLLRPGTRRTGLFGLARPDEAASWAGRACDIVVTGGVIAGSANLFNLLDLRPGRSLKAGLTTLALTDHVRAVSWAPSAAIAGAAAAAAPDDLAGATMLGDTGANAVGAAIGTILAETADPARRRVILAVLAGLTLASEKVSFTSVIESTPGLREIDSFGRGDV